MSDRIRRASSLRAMTRSAHCSMSVASTRCGPRCPVSTIPAPPLHQEARSCFLDRRPSAVICCCGHRADTSGGEELAKIEGHVFPHALDEPEGALVAGHEFSTG